MTTAWFFDCDGTLVEFDVPYGDIFVDACVSAGVSAADAEALFEAYNEPFFEAFESFHPDPYAVGIRTAADSVGVDVDTDALVEALLTTEVERTHVRPGTRDTLDALAETGAELGVLTNGLVDQQRRKLEHHGLFDRFDAYLPSYEVEAHKPDSSIFAAASDRLPADDHVYVGDSWEHDVEPAREAGFFGVHVDHEADAGVVSVRDVGTVGHLSELW